MLILLYLFNWGGYRILFYFMEQNSNERLESKLDQNNYAETDLIEFSVPLHLPYLPDNDDFERIDGEIVIDGILYHYVKQKVKNNQLVIQCIPNPEKKLLITWQENFGKSIDDIQQNKLVKKSPAGLQKITAENSDYTTQEAPCSNSPVNNKCMQKTACITDFEHTHFFYPPLQPPDTITA